MNKIKKVMVLLVVAILCMNINIPVVHAEDIAAYISVSSSQVNVGDSITVTVSYSYSGSFAADLQLSWSGPVEYSGGSIGGSGVISAFGNGSASATFTATGEGTASFSVSGAGQDVVTEADLAVTPQGASVTIVGNTSNEETTTTEETSTTEEQTTTEEAEDDGKSDNAFLSSLSINPGTLNPEFSPYTTTYSAQVDEDVTEIAVSATADDVNAGVSVWGASELVPGENWVQVAVTAENGDVRYYDIYVMVGEDVGTPFTEIDGVRYSFIDYEDGLEPPEGFEASKLKYEKWQVISYTSPNKKINIVPLVPEQNDEGIDYEWYMYLEDKNCFVKYHEYSSKYNRYVITDVPEGVKIPEGYNEVEIAINEVKIKAYQPDGKFFKGYDSNMKIYLVYAINIEGEAGFYNYDMQEDAFLRYNPLTIVEEVIIEATPTEPIHVEATPSDLIPAPEHDEGFFTKEVITYILFGVSGLLLIFIIIVICMSSKNKNLKEELEVAENMVHQLSDKKPANSKTTVKKTIDNLDIPQIDNVDYEKRSEEINNKIKTDYDASLDSAFSDDDK